jgi:uncharacterized coiled-coil DUF342 family protein
MTKDLDELEKRRDKINSAAEEHRQKRDEYNQVSKKWADKRDELNAKVRGLVKGAAKFKEQRDEFNKQVKDEKVKRDEGNRRVALLSADVNKLKYEMSKKHGFNFERMKRELRALEKRQETTVLNRNEEREIVESISKLTSEMRTQEAKLESDPTIKTKLEELVKIKDETEAHHKKVSEFADLAQKGHDEMAKLYDEADKLRAEADKAQDEFIKAKMLADDEHRKHVELIHQVRDYDKIVFAMKEKQKYAKAGKDESDAKQLAEEIFKKFKSGETLSTEDILILQKSGYL